MEKQEESRRNQEEELGEVPLSPVAKSKKKRKRSKKNLENCSSEKTQTQPVEQHEQEDLVPCPNAAKQDSVSETVASPEMETKEKRTQIEEGSTSDIDVDAKGVKTEEKKSIFKRLWSDEDEIVLLQAVMDFETDPFKDKVRFQDSVDKLSISIDFTNDQLMSKIRSLRRKFKSKENKDMVAFSNPHYRICFEMSKKIWGSKVVEEEEEEDERKNVVMVNGEDDWFDKSFLVGKVASCGLSGEDVRQMWKLVPIEKKRKLEEKWRSLEKKRVKFMLCEVNLVCDAASAIADTTT